MLKGTCLLSFIPIREEARSGSEMINSLLFGESYTIVESRDEWLKITTHFDGYTGWISKNAFDEFIEFDSICNSLYLIAKSNNEKIYIPCGGKFPSTLNFIKNGKKFKVEQLLKPIHHLPLKIRLIKTAQQFLNTPYLWGGRSFMGIDCSGYTQIIFKANGINLLRDTSQQITQGNTIKLNELNSCDLVFFANPDSEKVSHVGLMMDEENIIHSSGFVKIQKLEPLGLYSNKGILTHKVIDFKRIIE